MGDLGSATGVYVVAATPFMESGELDLASTARLVNFYLERGVDGFILLGVLGEAPKLTLEESLRFIRTVIHEANRRVPAIVGVSNAGFASMAQLATGAMEAGAAGVMVAPSSGLRTDDQIFEYFTHVREHIGSIPWVLQNHPQSTGVSMSVSLLKRIIAAHPSCVMLKHEDWPGLAKLTALRQAGSNGQLRHIRIMGGNGGLFLPEELSRGADGVMTGFAFPEVMVDIWRAHRAGEAERVRDIFDAYLPLARYEQQPGIGLAVRKYVLAKRGAIATPTLRLPRSPLSAVDIAEIELLMQRQGTRVQRLG